MTLTSTSPAPVTVARRPWQAVGVLTVVGGMATTVALRDPNVAGSLGTCPSILLFGVHCPGCGALRGMHDVIHGDFIAAMGHNILLLPALGFVMAWAFWQLRGWSPTSATTTYRQTTSLGTWFATRSPLLWAIPLLLLLVAFTVTRNLDGNWLAP